MANDTTSVPTTSLVKHPDILMSVGVVAILMVMLFGVHLRWLPSSGIMAASPEGEGFVTQFHEVQLTQLP